jgi:hypothetical protein
VGRTFEALYGLLYVRLCSKTGLILESRALKTKDNQLRGSSRR